MKPLPSRGLPSRGQIDLQQEGIQRNEDARAACQGTAMAALEAHPIFTIERGKIEVWENGAAWQIAALSNRLH